MCCYIFKFDIRSTRSNFEANKIGSAEQKFQIWHYIERL